MPNDVDGIIMSLVQFDFQSAMSAKGESPLTYTIGVMRQIFESASGFDGAKWPLFPSFELPRLTVGSAIPMGSVGVKNGRSKIMAMLLTVFWPMCGKPTWYAAWIVGLCIATHALNE